MKVSIRTINYYLLIFSIILGGTIMIRYLDISPIKEIYVRMLIFFFATIGIVLERPRFKGNVVMGTILITVFLTFYIIVRPYEAVYYLTGYAIFIVEFYILCYYLIRNEHIVELLDIYENIYVIIAAITLVFWLLGSNFHLIPYLADMRYTFADRSYITHNYFFLYFENPVQNIDQLVFGSNVARNCGIYCEVPAFAGRLLYAVAIEIFAHEKVNKRKLAILIVTIISTQSAKALLVLIVTFGLMYLFENNTRRSKSKMLLKAIGVIVVGVVLSAAAIYVFQEKSTGASYLARVNIFQAAIKTWRQNPFFGAGFNNLDAITINERLGHGYGGISMGLLVLLACGGIYFILFYLLALILGYIGTSKDKKRVFLYTSAMMIVNVVISNSIYQYPYSFMIGLLFAIFTLYPHKKNKIRLKHSAYI